VIHIRKEKASYARLRFLIVFVGGTTFSFFYSFLFLCITDSAVMIINLGNNNSSVKLLIKDLVLRKQCFCRPCLLD